MSVLGDYWFYLYFYSVCEIIHRSRDFYLIENVIFETKHAAAVHCVQGLCSFNNNVCTSVTITITIFLTILLNFFLLLLFSYILFFIFPSFSLFIWSSSLFLFLLLPFFSSCFSYLLFLSNLPFSFSCAVCTACTSLCELPAFILSCLFSDGFCWSQAHQVESLHRYLSPWFWSALMMCDQTTTGHWDFRILGPPHQTAGAGGHFGKLLVKNKQYVDTKSKICTKQLYICQLLIDWQGG